MFILMLGLAAVGCAGPTPAPTDEPEEIDLEIVFPQAATEIAGGQSFRITAYLTGRDGKAVEGADVEVELWTPDGDRIASLPCPEAASGRYLSDPIPLPLRNSRGTWRIIGRGAAQEGGSAEAEGQFIGLDSYSERLEDYFGFWIDLTDLFSYNVPNAEDPMLKTYSYEDGGYVILANNLTTSQINNSVVILDVHWRQTGFPADERSAADFVVNLAGPHRISLDLSPSDVVAEEAVFLGSPAWHVTGWWNLENALGDPRPDSPLDWMIFQCPGSDQIWAILITSNQIQYMDDLGSIRESFECPSD